MEDKFNINVALFRYSFYLIPAGCFSFAWIISYLFLRLVWGNKLGLLNPFILLINFFAVLTALLILLIISRKNSTRFNMLWLAFILIFLIVLLNVSIIKYPLMNYGDKGCISTMIGDNQVFPRWFIGTGILNFIGNHLPAKIFGPGDDILFVRIASSFWMCFSTVLILKVFPNRLSLLLTFTSSFWLLLSSGYDEYYPFIAPLFVLFLIFLTTPMSSWPNPFIVGFFVAILGLSYAGFLPLSLIILCLYFLGRGFRDGTITGFTFLLSVVGLIFIFWGTDIVGYWQAFYFTLNSFNPEYFQGQAITLSPFFKPVFAFGEVNLKRLVIHLFWSGTGPHFLLVFGLMGYLLAIKESLKNKKILIVVAAFLVYQILYFIFMIPQLGIVDDIDLYFTVYITLTFIAGWLVDRSIKEFEEQKQKIIRLSCFSFCLGNTAVVSIYLIILGLYALV